ncbi:GGDEF domain-containing protein [Enterobacteriaceae bacterium C34A]
MKNVQDSLRKRQALLISAAVTLLCVSLYVTFAHQKRMAEVGDRLNELVSRVIMVFNDNELIADATGVRYQQIRGTRECGGLSAFAPRDGENWAINGDPDRLNPDNGTLISRTRELDGSCMYAAAEFIRHKINAINPGRFDAHRYIIARDASWFYWFDPQDSVPFHFSDSKMANDPDAFFKPPESFYDRLLQKDVTKREGSSTGFYTDRITGERAYSVISYIYDLSGAEVSDRIVGYLLYDHSLSEMRDTLSDVFGGQIPTALMVQLVNVPDKTSLCLTDNCFWLNDVATRAVSRKYEYRYALPVYLFVLNDPQGWGAVILAPFIFLLLAWALRRRFNQSDIRIYTDPLTGCFTRKILEFVHERIEDFPVVILMDCNKFKAINDTWGHSAGDRALQVIARRMMSSVRDEKDLVIRTGGDEFVILLQKTGLDDARRIAERVAKEISAHDFVVGGNAIHLSVSWGVAPFRDDLATTIQVADADMYRMKQGRQDATLIR